jgi:hypothetical protein
MKLHFIISFQKVTELRTLGLLFNQFPTLLGRKMTLFNIKEHQEYDLDI